MNFKSVKEDISVMSKKAFNLFKMYFLVTITKSGTKEKFIFPFFVALFNELSGYEPISCVR